MTGVTKDLADLPKDRLMSVPLIHKGNASQMEVRLQQVAYQDVEGLLEAERSYGESWCKRGGVGAYMNICRKWDRLDQMLANPKGFNKYDIFTAIELEVKAAGENGEAILDAMRDLRRYLMLAEAKMATILGDLPLQRDNITARKGKGVARLLHGLNQGGVVPEATLATDQTRAVDERVDNTGQENVRGFNPKED